MLRHECEQIPKDGLRQRCQWYVELANRYHVCTDVTVSGFAFSLATEAHRVPQMFRGELERLVDAVRQNPAILRGARFLERATTLKCK
jgi:hypothetical protein